MSILKRLIKSAFKFFKKKKPKNKKRIKVKKKKPVVRKIAKKVIRKKVAPKLPKKKPLKKALSSKKVPSPKPLKVKPKITPPPKVPKEEIVGEVTHFFSRIQVVVVKITKGPVNVGDNIHIKGKNTDFVQRIKSMQIESVDVKQAKKGQLIGLKVLKPAHVGDKVLAAK